MTSNAVKAYNTFFLCSSNLYKDNVITLLSDLGLGYRERVVAQYQPTLS